MQEASEPHLVLVTVAELQSPPVATTKLPLFTELQLVVSRVPPFARACPIPAAAVCRGVNSGLPGLGLDLTKDFGGLAGSRLPPRCVR
jgi:hypothetical protein